MIARELICHLHEMPRYEKLKLCCQNIIPGYKNEETVTQSQHFMPITAGMRSRRQRKRSENTTDRDSGLRLLLYLYNMLSKNRKGYGTPKFYRICKVHSSQSSLGTSLVMVIPTPGGSCQGSGEEASFQCHLVLRFLRYGVNNIACGFSKFFDRTFT